MKNVWRASKTTGNILLKAFCILLLVGSAVGAYMAFIHYDVSVALEHYNKQRHYEKLQQNEEQTP